MTFDPLASVAYDPAGKRRFHRIVRRRLAKLAQLLELPPESYELRSNFGGIADSGEITLHHERFYVQVRQSILGPSSSILIRTCRGRRDYVGGRNHFASLLLLEDLPFLAEKVRGVLS
jgi:hypothetical protein